MSYTLGLPPTQDSSHHQDYEPFLGSGIPNLNLYLPLESWEGGQPKLYTNQKIIIYHIHVYI